MKIQAWGNSAGVIIPKATLKKMNVKIGQKMDASVLNGALVIKPAKPKYALSTLIAQCDPQAEHSVDVVEWQKDMPPVGNEVW